MPCEFLNKLWSGTKNNPTKDKARADMPEPVI
jgi:hypothetical protein